MDIEQFIQTEKHNLDRFAQYWKQKNFTNKGDNPNKLDSLEDWLEQFLFFVEKTNSKEAVEFNLQPRVAGLHKGNAWISDDFNEPLPDEFWLGENN